ncbi:MAG: hypothetical protein N3G20_03625, partial [Verrucomicrobiae bacterium]|nr:hypothetical protein [Verrucomicrobiae bacterium]
MAAIGNFTCDAEINVQVAEGLHHVAIGAGVYPDGSTVRVMAAPEVGYKFVRWEGALPAGREFENPLVFSPSTDVELAPVVEAVGDQWAGWAITQVVAWGRNDYGECNVLPGLDHVRAVAAARTYSVALKMDGTVTGWGTDVPDFEGAFKFGGKAVAVAAGGTVTFLLLDDGRLVECTAVPAGVG